MEVVAEGDHLGQDGSDLRFEFVEREGGHGQIIPVSGFAGSEGV